MSNQFNLLIVLSQKKTGNAIKSTENELRNLDNTARATSDSAKNLGDDVITTGDKIKTFGKNVAKAALQVGVMLAAMAANTVKQGIEAWAEYEDSLHQVFTLAPELSAQAKEKMSDDIRLLAIELKRMPEEVMPAVYQALSLGVPKDNVLDQVRIAAEAARAGAAGLEETLVTGQSAVNAYGGELYSLGEVYDILFQLIKNGAVTMSDLNNGFSEVTSVAGESRVPLEDIAAALAVMTKQGDSASEAFELLSILLMQLGVDGTAAAKTFENAWGGSFRTFIAEGGSLIEALQIMEQHATDTGKSLGSMIGGDSHFYRDTQAARAAMELTGLHMADLVEMSGEMGDAMGTAAEAAAEMSDTTQRSIDGMKVAWNDFLLAVGESAPVEGLFGAAATSFTVMSGAMQKSIDNTTQDIVDFAATFDDLFDIIQNAAEMRGTFGDPIRNLFGDARLDTAIEKTVWGVARMSESYAEFNRMMYDFMPMEERHIENRMMFVDAMDMNLSQIWAIIEAERILAAEEEKNANIAAAVGETRAEKYIRLKGILEAVDPVIETVNEALESQAQASIHATTNIDNLASAFDNLKESQGNYFADALDMESLERDLALAMFEAAAAAGANIETLEYLAKEAGYDEDIINQARAWMEDEIAIKKAAEAAALYNLTGEETAALLDELQAGHLASAGDIAVWIDQMRDADEAVLSQKLGVDEYGDSIAAIPPYVSTEFEAKTANAEEAIRRVGQMIVELDGKKAIVHVTTVYTEEGSPGGGYVADPDNTGSGNRNAAGGIVEGQPGTDRILGMLTAGEGIIPRESMDRIGEDAFEMLRQGRVPHLLLPSIVAPNQTGGNAYYFGGDTNNFTIPNDRTASLVAHMIREGKRTRFNNFMGR